MTILATYIAPCTNLARFDLQSHLLKQDLGIERASKEFTKLHFDKISPNDNLGDLPELF